MIARAKKIVGEIFVNWRHRFMQFLCKEMVQRKCKWAKQDHDGMLMVVPQNNVVFFRNTWTEEHYSPLGHMRTPQHATKLSQMEKIEPHEWHNHHLSMDLFNIIICFLQRL